MKVTIEDFLNRLSSIFYVEEDHEIKLEDHLPVDGGKWDSLTAVEFLVMMEDILGKEIRSINQIDNVTARARKLAKMEKVEDLWNYYKETEKEYENK